MNVAAAVNCVGEPAVISSRLCLHQASVRLKEHTAHLYKMPTGIC